MLNPNLADLNGHGVAEPPALLESALDVLVDHTFATSLTCLIFLCVALELVRTCLLYTSPSPRDS